MKRDLCYYLEADIDTVYRAFLTAAQNEPFERTCAEEDPYTFNFGLNFSMKYNMNGGALTLRFMPYSNGTAVNFRFSIAQVVGARYEKYALDLMTAAVPMIRTGFQPCHISVEAFLEYARSASRMSPQEPVVAPVQTYAAPSAGKPCPTCGKMVTGDAKFCCYCGGVFQQDRFCTGCGVKLHAGALFCQNCGKKVEG